MQKKSPYALCFICCLFIVLASGCANTHTRVAADIEDRAGHIQRVLLLVPDVDVQLKYISTDHYVSDPGTTEWAKLWLIAGLCERLVEKGYQVSVETVPAYQLDEYKAAAARSRQEMRELSEKIVDEDVQYDHDTMSGPAIKHLRQSVPPAWTNYDAVVFCTGTAKLETNKEWGKRWITNVTYNIMLLPLAFVSYIFPIALPITLSTSTFIFQPCPDQCYFNTVILDTKDLAIVSQYDYVLNEKGMSRFGDRFSKIGRLSAENMPDKSAR